MTILNVPSKKLARRILTEVEYEERIEGFRLRERTGIMPTVMYSFTEVVGFLSDPLPRIDFEALVRWVQEIMEDTELSEKIRKITVSDAVDLEKARHIRDLMGIRLVQSKKII